MLGGELVVITVCRCAMALIGRRGPQTAAVSYAVRVSRQRRYAAAQGTQKRGRDDRTAQPVFTDTHTHGRRFFSYRPG